MTPSRKAASAASKALRTGRRGKTTKRIAASDLVQTPVKRGGKKVPANTRRSIGFRGPEVVNATPTRVTSSMRGRVRDERPRPESVDEETIARLVAEAEDGIPAEKLRRRGRPAIGDEAASTYSVRLPDDLVTLTDERSEIDHVTRGETIRRALIDYLTK
jgi:hypothetical protein